MIGGTARKWNEYNLRSSFFRNNVFEHSVLPYTDTRATDCMIYVSVYDFQPEKETEISTFLL
jgi:hypothetical protein